MRAEDAALRKPKRLLYHPDLFFKLKKIKINLFRIFFVFHPAFLFIHPAGFFGHCVEIAFMVSLVHHWHKRLIQFWW